eukprot:GEMP01033844.1.p1 GENE.GEMP01033844.1~~GEMP01033844.1.p1  ORF type:complete len:239 (+),score=57.78 GEMP01033844.1:319-1035(+)
MCLLASTFSMRTGGFGKVYGQSLLGDFVGMYAVDESATMKGYYSLEIHVKRTLKWQRGCTEGSFMDWVTEQPEKTYDLMRGREPESIVLRDSNIPSRDWSMVRVAQGLGLELGAKGCGHVFREDASAPGSKMMTAGVDGERVEFMVPTGNKDIYVRYLPRHSLFRKPLALRTNDEDHAWQMFKSHLGPVLRRWCDADPNGEERHRRREAYEEACWSVTRHPLRLRRARTRDINCIAQY